MSNLVQELRELAKDEESPTCSVWAHFAGLGMISCNRRNGCGECRGLALNALADRIEDEHDPKPEPDTVEKVAREMANALVVMADLESTVSHYAVDDWMKRLEALCVR